jgi:hypothetical protein
MWKSLGVALFALALAAPAPAVGGPIGVSQSDLPSYTHQFTITNNSTHTIRYTVWWTNSTTYHDTLAPGQGMTYSIGPDSNGKFARPHVSFRAVVGGKTDTVYDLHGNLVTDGQTGTDGSPKPYDFEDTGPNTIDFFEL